MQGDEIDVLQLYWYLKYARWIKYERKFILYLLRIRLTLKMNKYWNIIKSWKFYKRYVPWVCDIIWRWKKKRTSLTFYGFLYFIYLFIDLFI